MGPSSKPLASLLYLITVVFILALIILSWYVGIKLEPLILLLFAGILAGLVNLLIQYVELPFDKHQGNDDSESILTKPELTDNLALVGYVITGIAGALLTPLANALFDELAGDPFGENDYLLIFSYGILFGYFTIRFLKKSYVLITAPKQATTVLRNPKQAASDAFVNSGMVSSGKMFYHPDDQIESAWAYRFKNSDDLSPGDRIPGTSEVNASGPFQGVIKRDDDNFGKLVTYSGSDIVFKDEEGTGADKVMMPSLELRLKNLANKVLAEWPNLKLRVTDAWDEEMEHSPNSLHYEARGCDLTLSDRDGAKLGRLGRLAVKAGFDWVYHEDNHIHVSVKRDFDTHPKSV